MIINEGDSSPRKRQSRLWWWLTAALLLMGLGVLAWQYFHRPVPGAARLVPRPAMLVLHWARHPLSIDALKVNTLGQAWLQSPEALQLKSQATILETPQLNSPVLVSLFPGVQGRTHWLWLWPNLTDEAVAQWQTLWARQRPTLKPYTERRYREQVLTEFTHQGQHYTITFGSDYVAMSTDPLVVESVIRLDKENELGLDDLPAPTAGEAVGIHVNSAGWKYWLVNAAVEPALPNLVRHISLVPQAEGTWVGQAVLADSGLLAGASGDAEPRLQDQIPLRAALVQRLLVGDVARWQQNQITNGAVPAIQQHWAGEAAICHIENPMHQEPARLVVLSAEDSTLASTLLQEGESVFVEQQQRCRIYELGEGAGPHQVLGKGWVAPAHWFLITDGGRWVAFATELMIARQYAQDLNDREVWGNNWRQQNRLKPLDATFHYGVYVLPKRALGLARRGQYPGLNQWLNQRNFLWNNLDFIALQLHNDGTQVAAQLALEPRASAVAGAAGMTQVADITLPDSAAVPLVLVPARQGLLAVTASLSGKVMVVNTKDKSVSATAGTRPLSAPVVADASTDVPVFWVAQGKTLTSVSTTAQVQKSHTFKLSQADTARCGYEPLPPCEGAAKWELRNLTLLEPGANPVLAAWNPVFGWMRFKGATAEGLTRPIPAALAVYEAANNLTEPAGNIQHVYIQGKGYAVAADQAGEVTVWGPDHPLRFDATRGDRLLNQPFLVPGTTLQKTEVYTLTYLGTLLRHNLEGQLLAQRQFYRPGAGARFDLLADPRRQTFAIAVQHQSSATFYSSAGDSLMTVPAGHLAQFQYVHYDALNRVFGVLEPDGLRLYRDGRLLTPQPIPASFPVRLLYSQAAGVYKAWAVQGRHLRLFEIKE